MNHWENHTYLCETKWKCHALLLFLRPLVYFSHFLMTLLVVSLNRKVPCRIWTSPGLAVAWTSPWTRPQPTLWHKKSLTASSKSSLKSQPPCWWKSPPPELERLVFCSHSKQELSAAWSLYKSAHKRRVNFAWKRGAMKCCRLRPKSGAKFQIGIFDVRMLGRGNLTRAAREFESITVFVHFRSFVSFKSEYDYHS